LDRLEQVYRAASLVRLEMPEKVPTCGAVLGARDAGESGDLALGLLDAVLAKEILPGPKGLVDQLGCDSLADRDEGDAGGIGAAPMRRAGDPFVDCCQCLRDRRRAF
jgi:hypothetical protein